MFMNNSKIDRDRSVIHSVMLKTWLRMLRNRVGSVENLVENVELMMVLPC